MQYQNISVDWTVTGALAVGTALKRDDDCRVDYSIFHVMSDKYVGMMETKVIGPELKPSKIV